MTVFPIHPAYTEANAAKYRALHDSIPFVGDPVKGAKALVHLSEKKAELPLRIQLGSDSFAVVRYQSMKTIEAAEKWESVAHSTNEEGVDADEYMKQLLLALG
ncbi:hypothetical protein B0H34DRAFT_677599 [Crassisporium funariophilum]|nr:hypothetical protein B0H34DRAFT_677599 [Crassisporium funariophilum]